MRVDCGRLDPAAVIRPDPGEWYPRMRDRLDEEELGDWRSGRDAIYQLAALSLAALSVGGIRGRRSAAVAATLLVTVGVWVIALWLWLDGGSLKGPVSDLVGTRTPSVSATAERPPAAQPPPMTTTTAERDAQAPAQQLAPPDGNAADQVIQVPSPRLKQYLGEVIARCERLADAIVLAEKAIASLAGYFSKPTAVGRVGV